jgi:hypothetical protein
MESQFINESFIGCAFYYHDTQAGRVWTIIGSEVEWHPREQCKLPENMFLGLMKETLKQCRLEAIRIFESLNLTLQNLV